ncbi:MAG: dTDP-4-dehydrorhamnose 3,5-epimerase [Gemmatimonadaceae bacterium]
MNVQSTHLPGVVLLTPRVHRDVRGAFAEAWNARTFADAGLDVRWVQDNVAESTQGVLRGLHCQVQQVQAKLVHCLHGEVFDVVVDLRANSATFGQWVGARLSARLHQALWVPEGFAHGYYVLSPQAVIHYKVTDYYAPAHERILRWDDPDVGIEWPLVGGAPPMLSERDQHGVSLREARGWFR